MSNSQNEIVGPMGLTRAEMEPFYAQQKAAAAALYSEAYSSPPPASHPVAKEHKPEPKPQAGCTPGSASDVNIAILSAQAGHGQAGMAIALHQAACNLDGKR